MDPVSIVGLVSSVVQIIDATASAIRYLNDFKNAPKDQALLAYESASLLLLMTTLKSRLEETETEEWRMWSHGILMLGSKNGAIVQLGDAMTDLTTRLKKMSDRSRVTNALVWTFEKEQCASVMNRIERSKSLISLALQGDQFALLKAIQKDSSKIGEITTQTSQLQADMRFLQELRIGETRQIMEEWVSPLVFTNKQAHLLDSRQPQTGKWFLESPQYQEWAAESDKNVLWCSGIPGAGKTILTAIVVDDLQKRFATPASNDVAYVYCDYTAKDTQSVENLIGSIWRQLVQMDRHSTSELQDLYGRHMIRDRTARPTLREVSTLLRAELDRHAQAFIIIDALDECSDGVRANLLQELKALPTTVHLLTTSRSKAVAQELRNATTIEIRASPEDIGVYVKDRVSMANRLSTWARRNLQLVEQIVTTITKNAKEMFLLAKLYMDSLCSKLTLKAVLQALRSTPKDLNDTYDEAMARISRQTQDEKELAHRVLSWVALAFRPLTVEELCHALAVEPEEEDFDDTNLVSEEDLTRVCAELIVIEPDTRFVRFAHYTVQQYMERILESTFPTASQDIAATCLTYLTFKSIRAHYKGHRFHVTGDGQVKVEKLEIPLSEVSEDMLTYQEAFRWDIPRYDPDGCILAFYQYAILHWAWHLRGENEKEKTVTVFKFLTNWKHWYPAISTVRPKWMPWIITALDLVAAYDLRTVCREIIRFPMMQISVSTPVQKHIEPEPGKVTNGDSDAGLVIASLLGRDEILKMLLREKTAKSRTKVEEVLLHRLLVGAAWSGNPAAVRALLEYSSIPTEASEASRERPFIHDPVIDALSQHGFTPTVPLICSVGNADSITTALRQGADVEEKDPMFGRTGLIIAAERGRVPFIRTLLSAGSSEPTLPTASVNNTDSFGQTALHLAVHNGNIDAVKALYESGADTAARDSLDRTPFMCANRFGRVPGDFPSITPIQGQWGDVVAYLGEVQR